MKIRDNSARTGKLHLVLLEGRRRKPDRQREARPRRAAAAAAALTLTLTLALAACGDPARDLEVGTVGYARGFAGLVAAEEPRAVLVGRDVLSAGGTAADAAVAMALTLTVTLPSGAGVGGGGLCVLHDAETKATETLDFLPPPSPGPVAVPALPRGLFALQAKYGRLRWESLVAPAENLARFGERVSRSLAADLAALGAGQGPGNLAARRLFAPQDRLLTQGETLVQADLAAVLARLRQHGVGPLYSGALGHAWVAAAHRLGSPLTADDLRAYRPRFVQTIHLKEGDETVHLPGDALPGHEVAGLWTAAPIAGGMEDAAARLALGAGGTGLVAADATGSAVVCALTMNGALGSGQMLEGLGMMAAVPAPAAGQTAVPLAVAMEINHNVNEFRAAAVAVGGGAAANLVRVEKPVAAGTQTLGEALAAVAGQPSGPAVVTAASCPKGLPPFPQSCSVARDPRSHGYGAIVGVE
jgi:gamma-glutamyltranspeptidase/glutathione hydrolase